MIEIALGAAVILVAVLAAAGITLWRARWPIPRYGPSRLAATVRTLTSDLRCGDTVTIRAKWPGQADRQTTFAGWSLDGRMILRTSPLGSSWRRPVTDLTGRLKCAT